MSFKVNNSYIHRLEHLSKNLDTTTKNVNKPNNNGDKFKDIFSQNINKLDNKINLSAHAKKRLDERNIVLSPKDLEKIEGAVKRAENKGAKESLILYKDLALITSIKNKTVITAINKENSNEEIFTNIDSAIIID